MNSNSKVAQGGKKQPIGNIGINSIGSNNLSMRPSGNLQSSPFQPIGSLSQP
jgi:hypothetical protein